MRDAITKFGILWMLLRHTVSDWRRDIWRNDLDAHYCCDGRECGCYAMTWRDVYSPPPRRDSGQ
jgi:hypothetical protein